MNKDNWKELQEYLPLFFELNLDMSFLFITEIGYEKGIIDATIPVRNFLKRNNLHNYETQGQGQKENGATLDAKLILPTETVDLECSLYRPKTKKGDPRIWFRKIKNYCEANSFIALATDKKIVYLINLSDEKTIHSLSSKGYVYQELLKLSEEKQNIACELYNKIKAIHNKGFLQTVVSGDTGVGMTLEKELQIKPNSSRKPDYKGIEIKTYRMNKRKKITNRSNLFSKTPDWRNSNYHSSKELLEEFGYESNGRINLKCSLKANQVINNQGLYLQTDFNENMLYVMHQSKGEVVQWDFEELHKSLLKKHPETFWIGAETKIVDNTEYFRYSKITHTKNPQANIFDLLIESGIITLDFTMHIKENGEARDHGYLFKISKKNLNKLFPEIKEYNLSN